MIGLSSAPMRGFPETQASRRNGRQQGAFGDIIADFLKPYMQQQQPAGSRQGNTTGALEQLLSPTRARFSGLGTLSPTRTGMR